MNDDLGDVLLVVGFVAIFNGRFCVATLSVSQVVRRQGNFIIFFSVENCRVDFGLRLGIRRWVVAVSMTRDCSTLLLLLLL